MMEFITNSALWNWESPVWFAGLLLAGFYVWLCRGRLAARSWWFVAALMFLIIAFVSPIGVLASGYLFSAHMVQHLLLLLVVPLCVLLSLPDRGTAAVMDSHLFVGIRRLLGVAVVTWSCGLGAMWLWHVPSLCSAATEKYLLGILRSISFVLAGLAFWWPIYTPLKQWRLTPESSVVYLFSACVGCTLLGIYITFTPISVCPAFADPANRVGILSNLYSAGLTPVADQQLGGLLMWVPPCSLYVSAILGVLCRWYCQLDHSPASITPSQHPALSETTS